LKYAGQALGEEELKVRVTVIGSGYVGLTSGSMFAELGHQVTCVDKEAEKIRLLKSGKVPFYEPGLDSLVQKHIGCNLKFTTSLASSNRAKVIMVAVGTPPAADGSPDLSFVLEATRQVVPYLKNYKVIILKSTVPVGTKQIVKDFLLAENVPRKNFDIVSNPEFLREGSAILDSFHPDRIVIGAESQKAVEITRSLYQGIECPVMVTSNEAAEMIKYAANAFLGAKISFINELAGICEKYGVDINEVARGIGYDSRIGFHFLKPGAGYGGSCLPKDLSGLISLAERTGAKASILKAVSEVNSDRPAVLVNKLIEELGDLQDRRVAVWGLAFKPETDDMRFAPALPVINLLLHEGAKVLAYDPVAAENARKLLPESVTLGPDMYETARGCDALLIITEWAEFARADLKLLKSIMKNPIIIDGRNIFSPPDVKSRGFVYRGVGR